MASHSKNPQKNERKGKGSIIKGRMAWKRIGMLLLEDSGIMVIITKQLFYSYVLVK